MWWRYESFQYQALGFLYLFTRYYWAWIPSPWIHSPWQQARGVIDVKSQNCTYEILFWKQLKKLRDCRLCSCFLMTTQISAEIYPLLWVALAHEKIDRIVKLSTTLEIMDGFCGACRHSFLSHWLIINNYATMYSGCSLVIKGVTHQAKFSFQRSPS